MCKYCLSSKVKVAREGAAGAADNADVDRKCYSYFL